MFGVLDRPLGFTLCNFLIYFTSIFYHFGSTAMIQSLVYRHGRNRERESEMFYLTTHSTHFIYGYMASDI